MINELKKNIVKDLETLSSKMLEKTETLNKRIRNASSNGSIICHSPNMLGSNILDHNDTLKLD